MTLLPDPPFSETQAMTPIMCRVSARRLDPLEGFFHSYMLA